MFPASAKITITKLASLSLTVTNHKYFHKSLFMSLLTSTGLRRRNFKIKDLGKCSEWDRAGSKLTAGREGGLGEGDGGVAEGLQVEASVRVPLQIQRGDDLRGRLLLLRARVRHGFFSGWW